MLLRLGELSRGLVGMLVLLECLLLGSSKDVGDAEGGEPLSGDPGGRRGRLQLHHCQALEGVVGVLLDL